MRSFPSDETGLQVARTLSVSLVGGEIQARVSGEQDRELSSQYLSPGESVSHLLGEFLALLQDYASGVAVPQLQRRHTEWCALLLTPRSHETSTFILSTLRELGLDKLMREVSAAVETVIEEYVRWSIQKEISGHDCALSSPSSTITSP